MSLVKDASCAGKVEIQFKRLCFRPYFHNSYALSQNLENYDIISMGYFALKLKQGICV